MVTSNKIIRSLLLLGGFLLKVGNRITEEFGLNQQQFVLLNEIVEKKEVNQKQLVGELLLEKSHVSKIVKKLHTAELISVSKSPYDMRTTLLRPTPKGKELWATGMKKLNDWNTSCLGEIPEKEQNHILGVLDTLQELMLTDTTTINISEKKT